LKNRRGLKAWLIPFGYGLERWAYTFQRISGVALFLYLAGHIIETSAITGGPDAWASALNFTQNSAGHLILLLMLASLGFHGINGVRLILVEFGFLLGRPARPEYPYRVASFSRAQRAHFWAAIVLTLIALIYAFNILFGEPA
jgi:succinate dehydrogenase cytochrome b556 subunit